MKKILVLFLTVLLIFSMTACTSTKNQQTPSANSQAAVVDERLIAVDITLPAPMFENEGNLNLENYARENGFKKAVRNKDGSVTITMSKAKHKEMLEELAAGLDESFKALINGKETPYIEDITHTQHFETVTADVDRVAYEGIGGFKRTPLLLGMNAMVYRMYTGEEISTEVVIRDADTREIISSAIYPDSVGRK